MMSADIDSKQVTESTGLAADVTDESDDSGRLQIIEIAPLTGDKDTDGLCTTECESGDWSAEVVEEVNQEPDDV